MSYFVGTRRFSSSNQFWTRMSLRRRRLALDVPPHHHEINTVLTSDIVERANVRMIQAGDGTGFPLEAFFEPGVIGKVRRRDLDGDGPLGPTVSPSDAETT